MSEHKTLRNGFQVGLMMGLITVVGCAAVNYKYFGLSLSDPACYDQGTLLGKQGSDGWKDIPFSECKPDAASKGKCTVELAADHFAKEKDLQECHTALDLCQRGNPPSN